MGLAQVVADLRRVRFAVTCPEVVATWEDTDRFLRERKDIRTPRGMWIRERAADAVAKLRGAS